jgi:TolB-like protein/tetratricopeptide (TPR) repeat protein
LVAVVGGIVVVKRLLRPRHVALPESVASLQPTRVAVMYFDVNGSDPEQRLRALADGLTEALIDRLTPLQANGLSVISRNGVRYFRGTSVSLDSIRKVLGTHLLISGSVSRSRDEVRVLFQLVNPSNGETLHSEIVKSRWNEPFALMDTLSQAVSGSLRIALGREIRLTQAHSGTVSIKAWELYRRAEAVRLHGIAEQDTGSTDLARAHLVEADSLFVLASKEDPQWSEPLLGRARTASPLAFMTAMTAGEGPAAARDRLRLVLAAIDPFVERNPQDARALEQRGILRHRLWLFSIPGPDRDSLLATAERDLRRAVGAEADRADAWAALSAIDFTAGRLTAAKTDAERAYGADAYSLSAGEVLQRLFRASFELHQDTDARRACVEYERRFGQTWSHAYCALMLMGWSDPRIDVEHAWEIYDAPSRIDSPTTRARTRPLLGMLVAAVLARAGLPDSARHVITRAHAQAPQDPEVLPLEAAARLLLGDTTTARRLMADYRRGNPAARAVVLRGRIVQPLAVDQGQ